MAKIHAELNNQSLNGTSSQEITRTTVGTQNGLDIHLLKNDQTDSLDAKALNSNLLLTTIADLQAKNLEMLQRIYELLSDEEC